jgi:tetratricopeptide (TPR) repeat protein
MKIPILIEFFTVFLAGAQLTLIFHEFGHAIPALIFSKDKVTVFIGSYGNKDKTLNFALGRLGVYINYKNFRSVGLCQHFIDNSMVAKRAICLFAGPFTPLLVGTLFFLSARALQWSDDAVLFSFVFLVITAISFVKNLLPSRSRITLASGKEVYNDGESLRMLFAKNKVKSSYDEAISFYNSEEYGKALAKFLEIEKTGHKGAQLFRLIINCELILKKYADAKASIVAYANEFEWNANDFCSAGIAYSQLDLHTEAIGFYEKALEMDSSNESALNNKGYTLNLLERYEEAIPLFDEAIKLKPKFAYSYNNRGLSKIKIGAFEAGLKDIQTSMDIDPGNSYAYKNLGIYEFDKGNTEGALRLFNKAKELDPGTHQINDFIDEAIKARSETI